MVVPTIACGEACEAALANPIPVQSATKPDNTANASDIITERERPKAHSEALPPPTRLPAIPLMRRGAQAQPSLTDALMSAEKRPFDPGDAAREAYLAEWTLCPGPKATHPIAVRPMLTAWVEALCQPEHKAKAQLWLGGSAVTWRLNSAWRAHLPQDLDPIIVLPRGPKDSAESLQANALVALSAVFAENRWPLPRITSHILKEESADALVLVRLGSHATHIDVRLAFGNSVQTAFDFCCNALVCDLHDSRRWGVLPGLDLKTVVDELNQGVYTQTQALRRDSLQRATKMRLRGFVPGHATHDQSLVPTLTAYLQTHEQAQNKGFALLFSEWMHVAMAGHNGPGQTRNTSAVGFLANVTIQVLQSPNSVQKSIMLAQLRRSLGQHQNALVFSPHTSALLSALQTDSGAFSLGLSLDALAVDTEAVLDASNLPNTLCIARVDAAGCISIRVFVPELACYLVWPLGRESTAAPAPQLPSAGHGAAEVRPALLLGLAALEPLLQTAPQTAHLAMAKRLIALSYQANTQTLWPVCLLWAAHLLAPHMTLDYEVTRALRYAGSQKLSAIWLSETQALAAAHQARGWQELYDALRAPDMQAPGPLRTQLWQRVQSCVVQAMDSAHRCIGAPSAITQAVAGLRLCADAEHVTDADALHIATLAAQIEPHHLDAHGLASMLGLWALDIAQSSSSPLKAPLAPFANRFQKAAEPWQKQVWSACLAQLKPRCLWRVATLAPHVADATTSPLVFAWFSKLSPAMLSQEPAVLAVVYTSVHKTAALDALTQRHDAARALLRTQPNYTAIGRILTTTAPTPDWVHLERLWLQSDTDFAPRIAAQLCAAMQADHPLFLSVVNRAFKSLASHQSTQSVTFLSQLWRKLQNVPTTYQQRMRQMVRAFLQQIDLRRLDILPQKSWPKPTTVRQWVALFAQSANVHICHINLLCATVACAREDVWLMLECLLEASKKRVDADGIMPILMALLYKAMPLLQDKEPNEITRAALSLSQIIQQPSAANSIWQHYSMVTATDIGRNLLRLKEIEHSLAIFEHLAYGPFAPEARDIMMQPETSEGWVVGLDIDKALSYALKNATCDLTLLNKWACVLSTQLIESALSAFRSDDEQLGRKLFQRALFVLLTVKPMHSYWRADPVFSALMRIFACPQAQETTEDFFLILHRANTVIDLSQADMQMVVRNRAMLELAYAEATTCPKTAQERALVCLETFGIDTCMTRPLTETLLADAAAVEPISLIVAQVAGSLCHGPSLGAAKAQARLAWLVEGLSQTPLAIRALYNLCIHSRIYDGTMPMKVALVLVSQLNTATCRRDWKQASHLATVTVNFCCAVVFERAPKHAINVIRGVFSRVCLFEESDWDGWVRLASSVRQTTSMAHDSALGQNKHEEADGIVKAGLLLESSIESLVVRQQQAHREVGVCITTSDSPDALLKQAQFDTILVEIAEGSHTHRLRALTLRLPQMQSALLQQQVLHDCILDIASIGLQDESLQNRLLKQIETVASIDAQSIMMFVDAMRTWRPLSVENYATLLNVAIKQRLKGGASQIWDRCLTHLFTAARTDLFDHDTAPLSLLLHNFLRTPLNARRRMPWFASVTQNIRELIDKVAHTQAQALLVIQSAQAMMQQNS